VPSAFKVVRAANVAANGNGCTPGRPAAHHCAYRVVVGSSEVMPQATSPNVDVIDPAPGLWIWRLEHPEWRPDARRRHRLLRSVMKKGSWSRSNRKPCTKPTVSHPERNNFVFTLIPLAALLGRLLGCVRQKYTVSFDCLCTAMAAHGTELLRLKLPPAGAGAGGVER
jgi:hypothetical protein